MMRLTKQTAKQLLAFVAMFGFIAVTAVGLWGWAGDEAKNILIGAWIGLVTKVSSDYFGENDSVDNSPPEP
jgi:hypothetical protein